MASDVEVRDILSRLERWADKHPFDAEANGLSLDDIFQLGHALAALEAREAQPKVERRLRLDLDTIESVLMEYLVTNSEIERIMVGMADRLGGARYRGHTHLGPNDECGNTDCDALGPHVRCFKDGHWLDDGSEM